MYCIIVNNCNTERDMTQVCSKPKLDCPLILFSFPVKQLIRVHMNHVFVDLPKRNHNIFDMLLLSFHNKGACK